MRKILFGPRVSCSLNGEMLCSWCLFSFGRSVGCFHGTRSPLNLAHCLVHQYCAGELQQSEMSSHVDGSTWGGHSAPFRKTARRYTVVVPCTYGNGCGVGRAKKQKAGDFTSSLAEQSGQQTTRAGGGAGGRGVARSSWGGRISRCPESSMLLVLGLSPSTNPFAREHQMMT